MESGNGGSTPLGGGEQEILPNGSGMCLWCESSRSRFNGLFCSTGRLGHLVVYREDNTDFQGMVRDRIREICRKKITNGVVGYHGRSGTLGEHFHIVHPCVSKTKWCKCHLRKLLKEVSPAAGVKSIVVGVGDSGDKYVTNILSYLRTGRRELEQVNIEGTNRLEEVTSCGCVNKETDQRTSPDICQFLHACSEGFTTIQESTTDGVGCESEDRPHPYGSKRQKTDIGFKWGGGQRLALEAIQKIVQEKRLIASDLEFDLDVLKVLMDNNLLLRSSDKKEILYEVQKLCFLKWNPLPFYQKVIELSKSPHAYNKQRYYSIQYSFYLMVHLLKHQFHTFESIKDFLNTIIKWADYEIPKKNTLYILGPSNCGKSWFSDSLIAMFWNVGYMGNMNKNQGNFWGDNCINRALIVFEEGNMSGDDNFVADFKRLAQGQQVIVNRKHKDAATISKTPLLVTANHEITINCSKDRAIIETRLIRYYWQESDFLKNCLGFPHPLVWQRLLTFNEIDYTLNPGVEYLNDYTEPDICSYDNNCKWFREKKETVIPNDLPNIFIELNKINDII